MKRPRSRRSARWLEAAGLLAGLLAGLGVALALMMSRPADPPAPRVASTRPPSPARVSVGSLEPDPAALDSQWQAYSDRSTCADWAGGDGVSAIRLDSSQLAWFFSDTFLGPAGPATGFSHLSGFLNNSVVLQTTKPGSSTFVTMTGGGACSGPGAPVASVRPLVGLPQAPGTERYWDADGIRLGTTIVRFYNSYRSGGIPFIPTGTVMATFGVSQLVSAGHGPRYGLVSRPDVISVPSYTPSSGGTPLIWGAALLQAGNTVYVYGTQAADPSVPVRQLYLARVSAARLTHFSAWRFYTGDGQWSADQSDAEPVQPSGAGISMSSGFSVVKTGGRYWLIQASPQPDSADIDAYPAATPWGPFDPAAAITLYHDSGIGLDAEHDYRIMYEARAEPALSTDKTLVISYNVNSEAVTAGCLPLSSLTNTVLQPRFVAVPTAVFAQGAVGSYHVGAGPSDYSRIVARGPGQWFNAWNYPGGCPPVPGLTRFQARPRPGAVRLTWPDEGLGLRYRVYLGGPGRDGNAPATVASSDSATIANLRPGTYRATVMPVNVKGTAGAAATVEFTVP